MQHLSCPNTVKDGKFTQPLYILPPPPTAYHLHPKKQKLVTKLFRRLEEIIKINQTSDETRKKFIGIKSIYLHAVQDQEMSFQTLVESILTWSEKNKAVVDHHRGWHFFFQRTATRIMVDDIREESRFTVLVNF